MRVIVGAATAVGLGITSYFWVGAQAETTPAESGDEETTAIVTITVPDTLSPNAEIGKIAYQAKCSACHAENGVGQIDVAPPLVHIIYEPSHHGDESFQRAVALGVRGHHWPFGDMPPVEGLTRGDVAMIIAYIRELQVANGID